jgi:pimeloyl-ACP methyl ester carboxylesterase
MRINPSRRDLWNLSPFEARGFEERVVELSDGSRVTVARMGQGSPLVMVAGLSGGWEWLAPLADRLARRRGLEVWVTSLRGDDSQAQGWLGGSSRRSMSDYAGDLATVLNRLGLERPTIFGVSFGGAVVLEYAVTWPERLRGLILQGTEARFTQPLGARLARGILERYPLPQDNPFVNQFLRLLFGKAVEAGPLWEFVVERCWSVEQAELVNRLAALEAFDVSDRLDRIDAPTLVLAGARDVIVPPSRQKLLAQAIDGADFAVIPDAGHIGFLTHPGPIAHRVADCLNDPVRFV